jgi:hypothetical protein
MQVIRHHRKAENIDAEDSCQKLQPIPHPLPPMLVVLPRELIHAA